MHPANRAPSADDFGPEPFVVNIACAAKQNPFYRRALWTGCHLQLTLMCIPPCSEIGLEVHPDDDQFLQIQEGCGTVMMGPARDCLAFRRPVSVGDAIFIPAGTWHNVVNTGKTPMKLCSIYAPPHHPRGTVHRAKAESQVKKDD